jgi:hypothetical protein
VRAAGPPPLWLTPARAPPHHAPPRPGRQSYGTAGASRPKLDTIEDELDQWGRPKKAQRTPIDALPPDAQEKALQQLEKQEGGGGGARREARGGPAAGEGAQEQEQEQPAAGGGGGESQA